MQFDKPMNHMGFALSLGTFSTRRMAIQCHLGSGGVLVAGGSVVEDVSNDFGECLQNRRFLDKTFMQSAFSKIILSEKIIFID